MRSPQPESGFSLVELSIVLVILGLLVGGILGGQSLIRAAELRVVHNELMQWQTAVNSFRTKYHALPGDMRIATRFWGEDSRCSDPDGQGSNTTPGYLGGEAMDGTCNGDGNGVIGNAQVSGFYELLLAWHHLQLAGLISGNYTGVRSESYQYEHRGGENAPASRYASGGWSFFSWTTGSPTYFELDYTHSFVFGGYATGLTDGRLLTPEEAWSIDSKMDDGMPGQGKVIARFWDNQCADAAANNDYEANYRLEDDSPQCALAFRNVF